MTKSKSPSKNFTEEFKTQAVNQFLSQNKSAEDVARELGIKGYLLRAWIRNASSAKAGPAGNQTLLDELAQLKKDNRQLKMELEILKKAASYFAKSLS